MTSFFEIFSALSKERSPQKSLVVKFHIRASVTAENDTGVDLVNRTRQRGRVNSWGPRPPRAQPAPCCAPERHQEPNRSRRGRRCRPKRSRCPAALFPLPGPVSHGASWTSSRTESVPPRRRRTLRPRSGEKRLAAPETPGPRSGRWTRTRERWEEARRRDAGSQAPLPRPDGGLAPPLAAPGRAGSRKPGEASAGREPRVDPDGPARSREAETESSVGFRNNSKA